MQISSRGEETPSESADGEAIEVLGSDGPQQANEDGDQSIVGTGRRFEST
jgi:hypothetical protein